MTKILITGPAPQNIGGISIHIRRLIHLLMENFTFDFVDEGHQRFAGIFNLRSLNIPLYLTKVIHADIVHIHSGNFILRSFQIIVCRFLFRKYTVVTVHRDPRREGNLIITKFLLSRCNKVIMVNKEGFDAVYTPSVNKYFLLPAFLPPVMEEEPELPKDVSEWVTKKKEEENACVLVSNAYKMVINHGEDLYGLDLCIDAMIALQNKSKDRSFCLVFVIADNSEQKELVEQYRKKIQENGLSSHILIWEKPLSFVRLVQMSDIVLRTTNTDGDAISVREALYLGKQIIASDIVKRPEGTILFKNRDARDLVKVIFDVASTKEKIDYGQLDYMNIYKKIYN